nr:MAG TPA: hypothetical protein [Caudoviricetes sp.]
MLRRVKSPVTSTSTTDISFTRVSGSTKASIMARSLAHCLRYSRSALRIVSPGPRTGLLLELVRFLRKRLNTIDNCRGNYFLVADGKSHMTRVKKVLS